MSTVIDCKVGSACNNDCIHCVIAPFREQSSDQSRSYGALLRSFQQERISEDTNRRMIVLTGGEPLLRNDFWRLVDYIRRESDLNVCVQTNGRLLEHRMLELESSCNSELIEYVDTCVNFVVSLHSFETVHNEIVRSRTGGNPFKETWSGLQYLIKRWGFEKFNIAVRMEIVLSRLNSPSLIDFLGYLSSEGIKFIGISYPHLEGYTRECRDSVIWDIAEGRDFCNELLAFIRREKDVRFMLEMLPLCLFADEGIAVVPQRVHFAQRQEAGLTVLWATGDKFVYTGNETVLLESCKSCDISKVCGGVWPDMLEWGTSFEMFQPVKYRSMEG